MISDPTALFALATFVGILGLLVLILPLLILFWSQMEPQLVGLISAGDADDEYSSHAVLPKLMKSFGEHIVEQKPVASPPTRKAKPAARRKPATSTSRSKASSTTKTVKAAPAGKQKAVASSNKKSAVKKAKPKPRSKPSGSATAKASASKASTGSSGAAKSKVKRPTPSGAKRDPILGVVYSKKPEEIDDLKEIKGVAKVIEAKLHKAGIYTFRQIVEWDAGAIDAFSEKLSFKGRIRNEGWQKQCAKFHKEKYGEKIG